MDGDATNTAAAQALLASTSTYLMGLVNRRASTGHGTSGSTEETAREKCSGHFKRLKGEALLLMIIA